MADTPEATAAPDTARGDATEAPRSGERIAKLLARAGIASRREVERLIEAGRVKIGEDVVTTPNTLLTSLRGVTVDDKPVKAPEPARLFLFHKPAGLLTAERDPAGRPTIYTALRNALPEGTPRLMPVGRLDLNTEGLLLLTNDGELKRAMELPSSGIPRTYRARTYGEISQNQLEELIEGVTIEGMHYGKIDANMERRTGRNQWIELTLSEGKNREVRRVLEHLGLEVSRLLRTSYGPFKLLDLPRGQAIEIRQVEVERFVKSLTGGPAPLKVNPHTTKAKPISTWTKPPPQPSLREPERPSSRPVVAPRGKPFADHAKPAGDRRAPGAMRTDRDGARAERPARATDARGERGKGFKGGRPYEDPNGPLADRPRGRRPTRNADSPASSVESRYNRDRSGPSGRSGGKPGGGAGTGPKRPRGPRK